MNDLTDLTDRLETVREIQDVPAICHCSSVVSHSGENLVVWYEGSYETSGDTVLKLSRRPAGSEGAWGSPELLFDFHGAPLGNPVLWRDSGKTVHLVFSVLTEESWVSSLLFYASSMDFGHTWTRPSLFVSRKGFMAKTQPILSSSGALLFPLYHEAEYCPYLFIVEDMEDPRKGTLIAETMARKKAIQPSICRIDEQNLLMLCRSNQGTVWRSLSFNDGLSWSILRPTAAPNPDSAVDVVNHRGTLLLCYNPSASQRDELQLAASTDRGATWTAIARLATGEVEYSYPSLFQDDGENLHITFTDNRYAIRYLRLSAGEIDEMLARGAAGAAGAGGATRAKGAAG